MGQTITAKQVSTGKKAKGGKKSRKFDRNQKYCTMYTNVGRQEVNKDRRMARTERRLAKRMDRRKKKTPKGWARHLRRAELRRDYEKQASSQS